jgi:hypothetical protein
MQANWVHCSVVRWGEVLREIVHKVFGAWSPNYLELALAGAVPQPVKLHVDGFGAALFLMVSLRMPLAHLLLV